MSNRFPSRVVVVSLLAIGLAFPAVDATAQEDDGGLIVETRAAETGRPLAGVEVTVTDRDGSSVQDKTGSQGKVEFGRLVPGL